MTSPDSPTTPPAQGSYQDELERMADAIDAARYAHPTDPRERPRPFSEADKGDREYAFRLARAAQRTRPPAGAEGEWPTHCMHGRPIGDEWCPQCKASNLVDPEVPIVAWAILRSLHENVPEAERPLSWSDVNGDQEQRIRAAAVAAIETLDAHRATLPSAEQAREEEIIRLKAVLEDEKRHSASQYLSASDAAFKSRGKLLEVLRRWEDDPSKWDTEIEDRDFRQIRYVIERTNTDAAQRAREEEREAIDALLATAPILTASQREQLTSGIGTILPSTEVFSVGWQSALWHVRRELSAIRQRKGS